MSDGNNDILKNNSFHDNDTCALCGRIPKNNTSIEETVDWDRYLFDSQNCITIFKKLANLYGQEFKSISDGDQYVYDSNLKRYVLKNMNWILLRKRPRKLKIRHFKS